MKTIKAGEIAKNLPMEVKCLSNTGMFQDTCIKFIACAGGIESNGNDWRLMGHVAGNPSMKFVSLCPETEFGIIKND